MNLEQAKKFLANEDWVVAKSYSETYPHFYLQRKKCSNQEKYEDFLRLIRKEGVVKSFYSKQYIYMEIDGFEYWEMGRPINAVQVLNKAIIDDSKQYRKVIVSEENKQLLRDNLNLREKYITELLSKKNHNELELTQIEFLMNNTRRIHGGGKNIIDSYKIKLRYNE